MNVMGIIFANDGTLGELTQKRTMASLPFGGRYRQVDFALSNLCSAGVRRVGIVTRHNYKSLLNHVGSGEEWGLEIEDGGLEFLTPYAMSNTGTYRGKLESISQNMDFLSRGHDDDLVVMIDSAILSNIDLKDVIANHIASGKDVTVVTKAGIPNGTKMIDLALKLGEQGEVTDIAVDYEAPADYVASMDIFVLNRKWLMEQVKEHIAHNRYHMDRDLVLGGWQQGKVSVNAYQFPGVVLFNESIAEYYHNSLELIHKVVRHDVFGYNHPVYTRVRDCVPTYYGENSQVDDCIVADGCMLEGKAVNSLLFRQVTLGEGAEVDSCIVMANTVIGEGSYLKCVILDKDVVVRPGSKLVGTPNSPIIIKRGEIV